MLKDAGKSNIKFQKLKMRNHHFSMMTSSILHLVFLFLFSFQSAVLLADDWPMWRYNAQRCAASPEMLPAELNLQWIRKLAPPKPAWPASQDRLQFDTSYEPVVAGKTVFVGSM
ncbi:hypothetical protein ACFL3Q_15750, partial [Planctomycetota bacterium]